MSFPQIPFSMIRSRKVAIASSEIVQASASFESLVYIPKPASSGLVLSTVLTGVTGDFYLASSDVQIIEPNLIAQGSLASESSTNDKLVAYWNFNSIENREYTTGSYDNFFVDSVNDPSLAYALDNLGSASAASGLIGNALIPDGNLTLYSNETIVDPATNGFDFIGVAMWVKLTTTDFSGWVADEFRSRTVYSSGYHSLDIRVITADPMDINSIYVEHIFQSNGVTCVSAIGGVIINDYHLLVCEINTTTGEINLRLDTNLSIINTYTSPPFPPYSLQVGDTNTSNFDLQIDEMFIFKESLTDIEVAAIYNGGAGQTYPFP